MTSRAKSNGHVSGSSSLTYKQHWTQFTTSLLWNTFHISSLWQSLWIFHLPCWPLLHGFLIGSFHLSCLYILHSSRFSSEMFICVHTQHMTLTNKQMLTCISHSNLCPCISHSRFLYLAAYMMLSFKYLLDVSCIEAASWVFIYKLAYAKDNSILSIPLAKNLSYSFSLTLPCSSSF